MKSIETKYVGPSNVKGSRIIATDCGDHRLIMSYDCAWSNEENHMNAAKQLCERLHWTGSLWGGHTKSGMVFVFADSSNSFTVNSEAK